METIEEYGASPDHGSDVGHEDTSSPMPLKGGPDPTKPQQQRRLTKENIDTHTDTMSKKSDDIPMPSTTQAQLRRQSKWDPKLTQLTPDRRMSQQSRRTSFSGLSMSKPPPARLENTYKMQPDTKFESYKAKDIILQTLKEWLTGVEYSPNVRKLTTGLTEEIKKRVKALNIGRYKYVVTVTICQDAKQSMQIVSRCMWNKDTDNFAEATFKNADVYAMATVYACYFE